VVHLTTYLLALDEQYDQQASELRECLRGAEEAKIFSRMLKVPLAEAHANLAAAKSREAAMAEAIKVDQDRHAQELEDWCCCKKWQGCCKLYSLICDPDVKMWIFVFFLAVCSTKSRSLVFSSGYLVSNERRVLLGGH
jgi:hypothetical protein